MDALATQFADRPDLAPQRVRHPLRFRALEVRQVQQVTPHLVRVTLAGDALEGFASPGFDDHVKLCFPDPATGVLALPTLGDNGLVWPDGMRPILRDYTPRAFDTAAHTLDIDFALHEAGSATRWAQQARVGQMLGIGGPKGSFLVPTGFDRHLLIGDDTALPAIARRLAELPAGAQADVLAEVDGPDDQLPLPSAADVRVVWVHRSGSTERFPLLAALRRLSPPSGVVHAWVACESAQAKAVRACLIAECGANPQWVRASGYWRQGATASHEAFDR